MKIRTLALSAVAFASSACQQAPPDSAVRGLTLDDIQARLTTTQQKRGLSATGATEVGRFSAYVTQVFEGIPAPIEYMREKCPEKVLSAKTAPLYGLEAPYAVRQATSKASGVFDLPIDAVNPAVDATYTGEYVVIDFNGALISLFPEGTTAIDGDGKALQAGAKILRQVSAVASLVPWEEEDEDGRLWAGVRISASAYTPAAPPPALKDALAAQWKAPCQ